MIAEGSIVWIKSGSMPMTVEVMEPDGNSCTCIWNNGSNGGRSTYRFSTLTDADPQPQLDADRRILTATVAADTHAKVDAIAGAAVQSDVAR